jgi:hypothetical protein
VAPDPSVDEGWIDREIEAAIEPYRDLVTADELAWMRA